MKKDNAILDKSKAFALRIIQLYKYLCENKCPLDLARQVLKSGTSIGANVSESICAQSEADFYCKLYIAYKETNETSYWLELLHASGYIDDRSFESIYSDCGELIKLLASITKNQK